MTRSATQAHYGGKQDDLNEVKIALIREINADVVRWSSTFRVAESLVRSQCKYRAPINLDLGLKIDVRLEQATGLFEK
jgi:hypothetical protein